MFSQEFTSLQREAALAADLIASGAESLSRARVSTPGRYYTAFFGLSIGIERLAKLALVLDRWKAEGRIVPLGDDLIRRGHDISTLVSLASRLSSTHRTGRLHSDFPDFPIHGGIIKALSAFAKQQRYSNLDSLSGRAVASADPIAEWFRLVQSPIIEQLYPSARRRIDEAQASALSRALDEHVSVIHQTEDRLPILSVAHLHVSARQSEFANREARVRVLQIVRCLVFLVCDLADDCRTALGGQTPQVPFMDEILVVFKNEDRMFRRRKTYRLVGY